MSYDSDIHFKTQISMSVRPAMVAVNKSALTQLDHLSAHVIQVILWLVVVFNALVSLQEDIASIMDYLSSTYNYCYISDINECESNNGGCQHNCSNSVGSFQCSCLPGHTLDSNGLQCSGKINVALFDELNIIQSTLKFNV